MKRHSIYIVFIALLILWLCGGAVRAEETITEAELVRRTRELFDTAAQGDQAPWQKYFADDGMYFDEKGRNMPKAALLASIEPLPPGYSGTIKLVKAQSKIEGVTAILSYDLDETEFVFGQELHARYHATDTWLLRRGVWQILAGQMLRYYEDPPLGRQDVAKLDDYVGAFKLAESKILHVRLGNGALYLERDKTEPSRLHVESGDIFFRKDVEGRIVFRRNNAGTVDACIYRRNNEDIVWLKIE